ncbi:MAG: acetylglutamate kinase [Rhodothermaceae bacterium]|nr:acetylglutamate kinase [Rhodothermaceae bacterium]
MEPVVVKLSGGLTESREAIGHLCDWVNSILQPREKGATVKGTGSGGTSVPGMKPAGAGRLKAETSGLDPLNPGTKLSGESGYLSSGAHVKFSGVTIVHGGGRQINAMSEQLGIPVRQVAGRRITDKQTMDVLLATVGGTVNRKLVSEMRRHGLQAVGLTGADGELTTAVRREPLVIDGEPIDFGYVGHILSVQPELLQTLMEQRYVPVVACLTWSEEEGMLNINADTMAIEIAGSLFARELVMLMEPEAVLDAQLNPIASLTFSEFQQGVTDGWISAGMRPKLETGFKAFRSGLERVRLTNPEGLAAGGGTILINDL